MISYICIVHVFLCPGSPIKKSQLSWTCIVLVSEYVPPLYFCGGMAAAAHWQWHGLVWWIKLGSLLILTQFYFFYVSLHHSSSWFKWKRRNGLFVPMFGMSYNALAKSKGMVRARNQILWLSTIAGFLSEVQDLLSSFFGPFSHSGGSGTLTAAKCCNTPTPSYFMRCACDVFF